MSSHRSGKCNKISNGSASAAMIINSLIPLFSVLVASLAPFLIYFKLAAYWIKSIILPPNSLSAKGVALGFTDIYDTNKL